MARIFIRNGPCGVEEFFKAISTESKAVVLQACCERESATFQVLREALRDLMDAPTLSKRLTEFMNLGMVEKLTYSDSKTVYRITQKAVDYLPVLKLMQDFCRKWFHEASRDISSWTACTKKLLGSRWNARIIWLLFVLRSVRFNELKHSIEGISFKMLTQQLRTLEDEGVILRTDFHENPPHVEYALSKMGDDLYGILILIAQWNSRYGHANGMMGTNIV